MRDVTSLHPAATTKVTVTHVPFNHHQALCSFPFSIITCADLSRVPRGRLLPLNPETCTRIPKRIRADMSNADNRTVAMLEGILLLSLMSRTRSIRVPALSISSNRSLRCQKTRRRRATTIRGKTYNPNPLRRPLNSREFITSR